MRIRQININTKNIMDKRKQIIGILSNYGLLQTDENDENQLPLDSKWNNEVVNDLFALCEVSHRREQFDNFYKWLDNLTQDEYDDMSLTDKIEKYFFKN